MSLTTRLDALKIDPNSALEDDLQEDDKATLKENEELIDKERRGRQNSSEYLIPQLQETITRIHLTIN